MSNSMDHLISPREFQQTEMNCLTYRRLKLEDPRHLPNAALAHMRACPACERFSIEINESEAHLAAVLDVPIPEGLADRIILQRKLHGKTNWTWLANAFSNTSPRLYALAASVVLTIAIIGNLSKNFNSQDITSHDYAKLAIAHVKHEPEAFTNVRDVDPEYLRTVMHNFGGTLQAPLGRVRYMTLCPVAGGTGWHIVFETEDGLATLILVPTQKMDVPSIQASEDGWTAIAQPGGQGYYAIITHSAESLKKVDALVKQRVRWES